MNFTTLKLFFCCCITMTMLAGCDREEETIPTYLEILPFELTTDPAIEGSASEKIVDAWLYVGTEFLGAYELPATVPVLASGSNLITIFPGIKVNGFASRAETNFFYEKFETTLDLKEGEITTIQPTTVYSDLAEFAYIENFDAVHTLNEDEDGNPNTFIEINSTEAFENGSGCIRLDADNVELESATSIRFENLPTNNSTVYLEMDYKNDVQFAVGLIGHRNNFPETKQYIIVLNTTPDWNKIYIDLTGDLSASALEEYQLVVNAILPVDDSGTITGEGNVYLDNIKIVHVKQ